ncbi:MAG: pirin family protein [Planctomycetes bacterium]|nr:pirin family protein [Planctomycetota bacterium]
MITKRPANDRGLTEIGWLHSRHSFSFGNYYDPENTSFRALRVINDDIVAPGMGFDTHPHRDMEILTWVLTGALQHRDSLGSGSVIRPGELQRMSAGTGIAHSEFNPSETEPVHLLQIWLMPDRKGHTPSYDQRDFTTADLQRGGLTALASPDGRDGSMTIHRDTVLYHASLKPRTPIKHTLAPNRHAWVQVTHGSLAVNGVALAEGDGAAISDETQITLTADTASSALVFDLD